jgi:Dolichyl-phosphate-mannose-protein mannosyltransferase
MIPSRRAIRLFDLIWLLAWGALSSVWCLTAARELGGTFDEPVYLSCGLEHWRTGSCASLMRLGTMPLPVDIVTLPLSVYERWQGVRLDPLRDWDMVLPWARSATLFFWWLLLIHAWLAARSLSGPWAGRLVVALLACEPSILSHAGLATTDIAITACLLALVYYFRTGRDKPWLRRVLLPAFWFGLALLTKASALVYAPVFLLSAGLEHLVRTQVVPILSKRSPLTLAAEAWNRLRPLRRDMTCVLLGGLVLTFVYCGSDWKPEESWVQWSHTLPAGPLREGMVWTSEHLCIFSNAGVGMVRQITHNVRGHGAYLAGCWDHRALWFYFPLLITIKLTLSLLALPALVLMLRPRALLNWPCLAGFALFLLSPTFRVQIGIRIILPLVVLGVVGLAAALVRAVRDSEALWRRQLLIGAAGLAVCWSLISSVQVWPNGISYINELWGGTQDGYACVSEANYDWGQGLPELARWQREKGIARLGICYYGTDPRLGKMPVDVVPLYELSLQSPEEVASVVEGKYLAVSISLLNHSVETPGMQESIAFLNHCRPVGRTTTFLIYDFSRALDDDLGTEESERGSWPVRNP